MAQGALKRSDDCKSCNRSYEDHRDGDEKCPTSDSNEFYVSPFGWEGFDSMAKEERPFTTERKLHEVVELTKDCELGEKGERAVVIHLEGKYMTLLFSNRTLKYSREQHTGADYLYVKKV